MYKPKKYSIKKINKSKNKIMYRYIIMYRLGVCRYNMYLLGGSLIVERKCFLNTNTPIIFYIIIGATRYAAYKRMRI